MSLQQLTDAELPGGVYNNHFYKLLVAQFSAGAVIQVDDTRYDLVGNLKIARGANQKPFKRLTKISGTFTVIVCGDPDDDMNLASQTITGSGTAGTPSGGVVSVQGVAGMTPLVITDASGAALGADVTSTGALGAANANVQVALTGRNGCGVHIAAGTLAGSTIVAEFSSDGGTTWQATAFYAPGLGTPAQLLTLSFTTAGAATAFEAELVLPRGATHARVRVSVYGVGTCNATLRATVAVASPMPLYGLSTVGAPTAPIVDTTLQALYVTGAVANGTLGGGASGRGLRINGYDEAAILERSLRIDAVGQAVVSGGKSQRPSYSFGTSVAPVAANFDLVVIEAPATLVVRFVRLWLLNPGNQTAAGIRTVQLIRTTTAGAGGVSTAGVLDGTDAAFGGIVRAGAAGLAGTLGAAVDAFPIFIPAALAQFSAIVIADWSDLKHKQPTIASGVTNGITIRDLTGGAGGATLWFRLEFTTEPS